ncbi:PilN domain-containing protein [Parahaliea mediterranea]|uniref:PilN domain-containing protein n=1 Tax=Parahaliea mediterranea TaxID=651086 RepID=UPI000E2E48EC|nr:PilN domain-containing protein [Parahaliea mediterranea]
MLDASQKWQLFGFDVREIGKYWQHAWAEFLWGDRSPVRSHLDELVRLQGPDGERYFHGGVQVDPGRADYCEAIQLPADLVLSRALRLPLAAEADINAVMQIEVASCSPFPAADTAAGWTVQSREDSALKVQLAIASLSATMTYLGSHYDIHKVDEVEVWADGPERPIVLRGFGEGLRLQRYKRRLQRIGLMLGGCVVLVLAMLLVAAGGKYLELRRVQAQAEALQVDAATAQQIRGELQSANETAGKMNEVLAQFPNPHFELARITALLGDDAYVTQFTMRGSEIRLRGRATDAAGVMQSLSAVEAFAEVSSPAAITRLGNTGQEQFTINIKLRPGAAG